MLNSFIINNQASTAPNAPTSFSVSEFEGCAILDWVNSEGVTGNIVERFSSGSWTIINSNSLNSYSDCTVSSGLTYKYRLKSFNAGSEYSGYSAEVTITLT